ncbi:DEAD/DEAH box helicase [Oceanispirochaeta crateris]|uniref:DEAD-box ATP-dependent RNA helicase RhpA n=1 Tax=Oceanispirochaeta crateris TaxID=2518645 RepID=A0A5C1QHM1_9SPIO|nr:DEAD/DEAH box helicase [Oceanispirochaeta crateris]QEN07071.1 DEAD/DEAH box helicase [Oceanispirochaeta crateris]
MTFTQLGLKEEILKAVQEKGYKETTPIQAQAIPAIMKSRDVLGGAQTGTGKTAAFALPLLHRLSESERKGKQPRVLVLTPTRELAEQVGESFRNYGKYVQLKTTTVYGGVKINPQIGTLRKGVDILVATPGRLLDHLSQKTVSLSQIETLVLDEADRMLDMGFIHDIKRIMKQLPQQRQNLLFSATYSKDIRKLSDGILNNPVSVEVAARNTAAEMVDQSIYKIDKRQKRFLLSHLIKEEAWFQVLVFVRTKHGANRLAKQLASEGISTAAIHGDKSQNARIKALESFKKGDLQALIATDVAARGIHLEGLSHVVNFDLPQQPEDYVHRIGRTGRAGKSGSAISLVSSDEKGMLQRIELLLKKSIHVKTCTDFVPAELAPVHSSPARSFRGPRQGTGRNYYQSGDHSRDGAPRQGRSRARKAGSSSFSR